MSTQPGPARFSFSALREAWWHWPAATDALSAEGRARLLDMSFAGLRYSSTVVATVSMPLILFLRRYQDTTALWLWLAGCMALAAGVWWLYARYRRERLSAPPAALCRAWQPWLGRIALAYGAALTGPLLLTLGRVPLEFTLFLYVVLVGVTAANVTHHTPVIGVFWRFLLMTWSVALLALPWTIPAHWPYFAPIGVLFVLGMARHAITAQRFVVGQVALEERSQQLAAEASAAHQAAEQALAERNRFLATASHDLRQPVHAMSMLTEAIRQRSRDPALAPLLADLQGSMAALGLMFNSLLDLSRIEAGTAPVRLQPVPLGALLDEAATLFRAQAARRGLRLRVHRPPPGAAVLADAALLRQALANLVHNALRYTPQGGVLLAARRAGARWRLEVWDTGIGVASADEAHIFSPYYRSRHAWQADDAGHGLGLAVVQRCATLIGADLGLRSRLGRGSRFWLDLPDAGGAAGEAAPIAAAAPARLQGRCLVLDDDPAVIAAWRVLLQGWGVDALCVGSGAELMAGLDAGFAPQVILCDERLRSGESGFDVLQAALARCPEACGAMVSGEFDSAALAKAEAEGYLVLRKPVEPAQLHALLARWLQPQPA